MDFHIEEAVTILFRLLPGFAAAWVYYAYTAHRKPKPFERTIQALIFTGIVLPFVSLTESLALALGRFIAIGDWTENSTRGLGMLYGFGLGMLAAYLSNTNKLNAFLSKWNITKKTSYSSEWYSVFHNAKECFVYLNYKDGRRLYGWAEEYPDNPNRGHFVLTYPAWIVSNNQRAWLPLIDKMLVPADLIEFVEFEKPQAQWSHTDEQLAKSNELLLETYDGTGELENDGSTETRLGEQTAPGAALTTWEGTSHLPRK